VKTEESFALTLRQVWRFLRDCQVIGPEATIAQFDRIYYQGRKNHFSLLGQQDKHKFSMASVSGPGQRPTIDIKPEGLADLAGEEKKIPPLDDSAIKQEERGEVSDEEEDEEEAEELDSMFQTDAEDIHQAQK